MTRQKGRVGVNQQTKTPLTGSPGRYHRVNTPQSGSGRLRIFWTKVPDIIRSPIFARLFISFRRLANQLYTFNAVTRSNSDNLQPGKVMQMHSSVHNGPLKCLQRFTFRIHLASGGYNHFIVVLMHSNAFRDTALPNSFGNVALVTQHLSECMRGPKCFLQFPESHSSAGFVCFVL